jgi:hypothetical protein
MGYAVFFQILAEGFSLWKTKEGNKYRDSVYELEKDYLNEINKPRERRSNADLDYIDEQLYLLSKLFAPTIGKKDS